MKRYLAFAYDRLARDYVEVGHTFDFHSAIKAIRVGEGIGILFPGTGSVYDCSISQYVWIEMENAA